MANPPDELPPEELAEQATPSEALPSTEPSESEETPREETAAGEVGVTTTTEQPKPSLPPAVKGALRWLIGIVAVFLIGFLCAFFVLYRPQSARLKQANSDRDLALTQVAQTRSEAAELAQQLEKTQAELVSAQEEIARLENDVNMANLRVKLNRVQKEIYAALVALKDNDTAYARLLLTNTPKTLDEIGALLNESDQGVITEVQKRLTNALDSLSDNPTIAQADLNNLTKILKDLEDKLFSAQ